MVHAIVADRSSGASELGRKALECLAIFIEQCEVEDRAQLRAVVVDLCRTLETARPSMSSIGGLLGRWRRGFESPTAGSLADARRGMASAARRLILESQEAVAAVASAVAAAVPVGSTVITISRSSTVLGALQRLPAREVRVIVAESRPLMEGRTLARELSEAGVAVELITDAQMGHSALGADLALVGADAVLADGSVVNKAGTSLLALAAQRADIPFWVCCESFKRSSLAGADFPLEEGDNAALGTAPAPDVRLRNVVFDLTAASLVTRWFDETGSTVARPGGRGVAAERSL